MAGKDWDKEVDQIYIYPLLAFTFTQSLKMKSSYRLRLRSDVSSGTTNSSGALIRHFSAMHWMPARIIVFFKTVQRAC